MDGWMTRNEAAEYLRCHPRTLHRLTIEGRAKGYRLGGIWLYRRCDLDAAVMGTADSESDPAEPPRRKRGRPRMIEQEASRR